MPAELVRYRYNAGAGNVDIDFTEPLYNHEKFIPRFDQRTAFSGSGVRQVQTDFTSRETDLVHKFVPESEVDAVELMLRTWVGLGNTFQFFPDRVGSPGTFYTVEVLDPNDWNPKRMFANLNKWEFELRVRLAIT